MKVVNLTGHDVTVYSETGEILHHFPPSGAVVRANAKHIPLRSLNSIPVRQTNWEMPVMPEPAEDTIYIVSEIVARTVPHRADVFSPGSHIKGRDGGVIGCRFLACTPAYAAGTTNAIKLVTTEVLP